MDNRPETIGPGEWIALTRVALKATNSEGRKRFKEYVKDLSLNFKCEICREHIVEYLNENPIKYKNKDDLDAFQWVWQFHNTVNLRLGKPIIDFDDALEIHTGENSGCDSCSGGFYNYN